jgi:parallel beta-helix repeat protein
MLPNVRFSVSLLLSALLLPVVGQAANLTVNCGGSSEDALPTISSAIKLLNPEGPSTVTVSGSCHENILILSFDRLRLITTTGATINDASGGRSQVVEIEDSRRVALEGFTINGGADGVLCNTASLCYLTGNIVQGSTGQQGVALFGSSKAFLRRNTIQNNSGRSLTVANDSQVDSGSDTFKGNGAIGVVVNSGAYFGTSSSIIQNNGSDGVVVTDHSTARFISGTISGNAGNGVTVQDGADAGFNSYSGTLTVTANGGSGVLVRNLSFGSFSPGASITGNLGGTDVVCAPQFPATRGALTNIGGGKTNCVEP